mgnify:CR=1 FL=1
MTHRTKETTAVSKQKSHKADEDLRGQVRQLKSVIRNLQKRLRQYEKLDHYLEDAIEIVESEKAKEVEKEHVADKCPDCKKGDLRVLDLGRVAYLACDTCSYRVKRHGKKKD